MRVDRRLRDAQPFNQPDVPRQAGSRRLSQTLGRMKSATLSRAAGIALLVIAGILFWRLVSAFLASDTCLDAGGSYDYVARRCDYILSHPYVRFYLTWEFWVALFVSGIAGISLGQKWARSA